MTAVEHRFGPYGGQYVPETLVPALEGVLHQALLVDEAEVDRGVEVLVLVLVFGLEGAHQGEREAVALDGEEGLDEGLHRGGLFGTVGARQRLLPSKLATGNPSSSKPSRQRAFTA